MMRSSPGEGAAADEQYVGGVNLEEFLLRMLPAALRWDRGHGAFHDFQQGLLDAFTGNIAGDRGVVGFSRYFVDLVDVDDAALGALDIVIGGLEQLEDDVLDILTHVTGFRQRGGIGHGEGHVEDAGQGLREQGFARSGWANQQNVGFGDLDVVVFLAVRQAFIVVVNRHRQDPLGMILADHVVVQDLADLLRGRNPVAGLHQVRFVLFTDDIHAKLDALIADEDRRTGDQFTNLVLGLATERAIEGIFRIAGLAHAYSSPEQGAQ